MESLLSTPSATAHSSSIPTQYCNTPKTMMSTTTLMTSPTPRKSRLVHVPNGGHFSAGASAGRGLHCPKLWPMATVRRHRELVHRNDHQAGVARPLPRHLQQSRRTQNSYTELCARYSNNTRAITVHLLCKSIASPHGA